MCIYLGGCSQDRWDIKGGLFPKAGADPSTLTCEGCGSFALAANGSGCRHVAQGAVVPSAGPAQFQI